MRNFAGDGAMQRTVVLALISLASVKISSCSESAQNSWPSGTYGLPKPISGCPDGNWKEGFTYHNTEDDEPSNSHSDIYRLSGNFSQKGIEQRFCVKTDQGSGNKPWPEGKYCIYKKGSCPSEMKEGYIKWDDEHSSLDIPNHHSGELVDGTYDRTQTILKFCCKTGGDATRFITLPTSRPFYLFPFESTQCQRVQGMKSVLEHVKFDDNDEANRDDYGGAHPYGPNRDDFNIKLFFCHYEQGQDIIDDIGTAKQVDGKAYGKSASSTGLAVAIGCGIAGAIVGTATIAFAARQFLAYRAKVAAAIIDTTPVSDGP